MTRQKVHVQAVVLGLPILLGLGGLPTARGEMAITVIRGTIGRFTLTSPDPNADNRAILMFQDLSVELFRENGTSAGTFDARIGALPILRAPVANPPMGFTLFALSNVGEFPGAPYQKRIFGLPPDMAGVSFGLFGNTLMPPNFEANSIFVPTAADRVNTLRIVSSEVVRVNSSSLDFSRLRELTVELTADPAQGGGLVNLRDVIVNGGTATGRGTFVQAVPEPPSRTLTGVGGLGIVTTALTLQRRKVVKLG